jgi:hypothetical protein
MAKPSNKLFTEKDFKDKKDRLDRIKMSIIEPSLEEYLNNDDFTYAQKLHQAFALTYSDYEMTNAVKMIQSQLEGGMMSLPAAKSIYNDMCAVYDDFLAKNKKLEKARLVEKLYKLGKLAEEKADTAQDFDYVSKIYERAAKLDGLYDVIDDLPDMSQLKLPEIIELSSDPALLEVDSAE